MFFDKFSVARKKYHRNWQGCTNKKYEIRSALVSHIRPFLDP